MTEKAWDRFELTGAVEDYLRYRGVWRETAQAGVADCAADGSARKEEREADRRKTGYGTDDHGDGYGSGSQSLR